MEEQKNKKLKVWQIFLIIFGVLILIGAIFGNSSTDDENTPENQLSGKATYSEEKLTILSHELAYTDYGSLMVTGVAKNTAGKDLSYCEIDAKFYDSDNILINDWLDNINDLSKD